MTELPWTRLMFAQLPCGDHSDVESRTPKISRKRSVSQRTIQVTHACLGQPGRSARAQQAIGRWVGGQSSISLFGRLSDGGQVTTNAIRLLTGL